MTALELQDQMKDELAGLFAKFKYKNPDGDLVPLNIFTQHLPFTNREDEEDPFPYIIVRLIDGDDLGTGGSNYEVQVLLIIGIYDIEKDAQGHRDVLNIIHKIYERFSVDPILKSEAVYQVGGQEGGFHWAMQEDNYAPYFIGACTLRFSIPAIRREDKYS